ncbi:hypothetical protein AAE478_002269 [Parahypoxylon ruwenzoriense]
MAARRLFPVGIGTDICRIPRIYRNLICDTSVKFVQRILTPEELKDPVTKRILKCVFAPLDEPVTLPPKSLKGPRNQAFWRAAEFVAGRFSAKEATIKAYSPRKLLLHDVIITREAFVKVPSSEPSEKDESPSSPPEEPENHSWDYYSGNHLHAVSRPVAVIKGNNTSEDVIAPISISHDGDYATAMCMVFFDGPGANQAASQGTNQDTSQDTSQDNSQDTSQGTA